MGYDYPHDSGGYVAQQYLPDTLEGRRFYEPSEEGDEGRIKEFLDHMRTLRRAQDKEAER